MQNQFNQSKRNKARRANIILTGVLIVFALILASCGSATETPATEVPEVQSPADLGPTPDPNTAVSILPTPGAGAPAVVADINSWIRGGPGTNYPVYGAMLGGVSATVVGRSEDSQWWVISVPVAATGQGWISTAQVSSSNTDSVPVIPVPPIPPSIELQPPSENDPQATAVVEAYVRTGPGNNYPAYGIATTGSTGLVLGQSEDGLYWVVRLNPELVGAGFGWVAKGYTQAKNVENAPTIQTPPVDQPANVAPPPSGAPTGTAIDYLNVRTGPGTNYPILGVVAPGASAELAGKSQDGQWYAVKVAPEFYAAGQAWVAAPWVVTQNAENLPVLPAPPAPPVTEVPPPPTGGAIGTALETINVRSGPGTQYPSYGVVPIGASGQIIGISEDGQWWVVAISVEIDPSGQGWVKSAYVLAQNVENVPVIPTPPVPPPTELPPPSGDVPIGTALEAINLRSGPGTQFPSYGIAPQGAQGEVIGVLADGSWYQVKAPAVSSDGTAWVSAAYVSVTNADKIPVVTP